MSKEELSLDELSEVSGGLDRNINYFIKEYKKAKQNKDEREKRYL